MAIVSSSNPSVSFPTCFSCVFVCNLLHTSCAVSGIKNAAELDPDCSTSYS